ASSLPRTRPRFEDTAWNQGLLKESGVYWKHFVKIMEFPSHAVFLAVLQTAFLVLFALFVRYHPNADSRYASPTSAMRELIKERGENEADPMEHALLYPMFQDVHVMIFLGIGFLLTFLKRYGFSSVGYNLMIGVVSMEWALLVTGFFHMHEHHGTIPVNLAGLLAAEFSAATVLISFCVVLGKTTPNQLLVMAMLEIPIYITNEYIGRSYIGAVDIGDGMFIHLFAAMFGLAVSFVLQRPDQETVKLGSTKTSDLFAMVGSIFLWLFWPSFNAAFAVGAAQHRTIINTYVSLTGCTVTTFFTSAFVHPNRKFDMVHIANASLAGGVVMGSIGDMMVQPAGALGAGCAAGLICSLGFTYITPWMHSKLRIHDICGVFNLHGMPGLLTGLLSVLLAGIASEEGYGYSLYSIFPLRAPHNGTEHLEEIQAVMNVQASEGRSALQQAGAQAAALLMCIVVPTVGGLVTGLVMRSPAINILTADEFYDDQKYWRMEEEQVGDSSGTTK
ncbi:unnamed protein product, partial [Meganyctiphanes norvegica]